MLPTDSGVMRHASDQQTRLAMQGNQFSVQTGMNVGSMAGRAIQQGLEVAEFKRRGEVNRSRLATESLRRQELKMRMGQYQEELALRQTRSQTMLMEAQTAREMNALKMEMMEKGEGRKSSEQYNRELNREGPDGSWQIGDMPVSDDEAKNYALRGGRSGFNREMGINQRHGVDANLRKKALEDADRARKAVADSKALLARQGNLKDLRSEKIKIMSEITALRSSVTNGLAEPEDIMESMEMWQNALQENTAAEEAIKANAQQPAAESSQAGTPDAPKSVDDQINQMGESMKGLWELLKKEQK